MADIRITPARLCKAGQQYKEEVLSEEILDRIASTHKHNKENVHAVFDVDGVKQYISWDSGKWGKSVKLLDDQEYGNCFVPGQMIALRYRKKIGKKHYHYAAVITAVLGSEYKKVMSRGCGQKGNRQSGSSGKDRGMNTGTRARGKGTRGDQHAGGHRYSGTHHRGSGKQQRNGFNRGQAHQ